MKSLKIIVSSVLTFCLILGVSLPAMAAERNTYKYVAIGDSTSSGYNTDEFEYEGMSGLYCGDNKGLYPNLMGNYIASTLHCSVDVNCILPEGIRAIELRAILDPDFEGDKYCNGHILQWSDRYGDYNQLHDTVCNAIKDADLLSIDVCMSALGNYFLGRIKCALGVGDKDYDEFYGADLLATYGYTDCNINNALVSCRVAVKRLLAKTALPTSVVLRLLDTVEYTLGALMINFSESVKLIYELNPDIQLIAMSPFLTSCYDLRLNVGNITFSLGSLLRIVFSSMYDYMLNIDPNCNRYKVADMYGDDLRCFTDAIADGEWDRYQYVVEDIRSILLSHGVAVDKNDPAQDAYFLETVRPNLRKVFADNEFDIPCTLYSLIKKLIFNDGTDFTDSCIQEAAQDYDNASEISRLVFRVSLVLESWGCHPDYSGHRQKFEAMRKVFDSDDAANKTHLHHCTDFIKSTVSAIKENRNALKLIKEQLIHSKYGVITLNFRRFI